MQNPERLCPHWKNDPSLEYTNLRNSSNSDVSQIQSFGGYKLHVYYSITTLLPSEMILKMLYTIESSIHFKSDYKMYTFPLITHSQS